VAGGLFWYASVKEKQAEMKQQQIDAFAKNEFDKRNKTLVRHYITGVTDIEGEYKKVTVSDGDVMFSFEVPDKWLTETRNSGEVEMNTEELREFFATNYDGDIRAKEVCNDVSVIDYSKDPAGAKRIDKMCGQPYGDYWDFTWDMLKDMSYEEMKKAFDNSRDDSNPGYPNASVSSGEYIWYTDGSMYQTDFRVLSEKDVKQYYDKYKSINSKISKDIFIGGLPAKIFIDQSKGEITSGSVYAYIDIVKLKKTIVIHKQGDVSGESENNFNHILNTLKFE
jgi:hypothetical protein